LAVARGGFRRLTAAAAVGCLVLLLVSSAEASVDPSPGTAAPRPLPQTAGPGRGNGRQAAALTGCEQRLQPGRRPGAPVVAIVGASITAGVGAGDPAGSWAVLLARRLHWNAFVYGVPGAGYVHPGLGHQGPVAAEIARARLRALRPALVIVQAGHDDMSVPPPLERLRAEQAVARIKAEAPQARIALLTVFAGRTRPPSEYQTDQAIVAGGRAADPQVIIMDPLASGWRFPHAPDGLHGELAGPTCTTGWSGTRPWSCTSP
jgi:lysophospholipase L1-like esterase